MNIYLCEIKSYSHSPWAVVAKNPEEAANKFAAHLKNEGYSCAVVSKITLLDCWDVIQ